MTPRTRRRALIVSAAACAGVVVGHALTYLLVIPNPLVREALLRATGHAYWPGAVVAAVVLGAASLSSVASRHFARGLHPGHPGLGVESWSGLAATMGLIQVAGYLAQENLERL
ncbi:MAG TPA: hypothetical protein VID47_09510, partial [Actinomycetota bacterium]